MFIQWHCDVCVPAALYVCVCIHEIISSLSVLDFACHEHTIYVRVSGQHECEEVADTRSTYVHTHARLHYYILFNCEMYSEIKLSAAVDGRVP